MCEIVVCVFVTENFFYTFSIHLSFMNEFNTNLNIVMYCIILDVEHGYFINILYFYQLITNPHTIMIVI